jgi:hypothetical protein
MLLVQAVALLAWGAFVLVAFLTGLVDDASGWVMAALLICPQFLLGLAVRSPWAIPLPLIAAVVAALAVECGPTEECLTTGQVVALAAYLGAIASLVTAVGWIAGEALSRRLRNHDAPQGGAPINPH